MSDLDELAKAAAEPLRRYADNYPGPAKSKRLPPPRKYPPKPPKAFEIPVLLWVFAGISAFAGALYVVDQIYIAVKIEQARPKLEKAMRDYDVAIKKLRIDQ